MALEDVALAAEPAQVYGEVRVQTWSPFHYLCVGGEAPFGALDDLLGPLMGTLESAVEAAEVRGTGPVVLRFWPVREKGEGVYRMEAGYLVRPGTAPAPGTEVKALDAFRCATLLYSGSIDGEHMAEAYSRLAGAMKAAGLAGTGEGREWHLHFDGDASPNNVVMLQQGIRQCAREGQ